MKLFNIVQIGAGGTGRWLNQMLIRFILEKIMDEKEDYKFVYQVYDLDTFNLYNSVRQNIYVQHIDENKAKIIFDEVIFLLDEFKDTVNSGEVNSLPPKEKNVINKVNAGLEKDKFILYTDGILIFDNNISNFLKHVFIPDVNDNEIFNKERILENIDYDMEYYTKIVESFKLIKDINLKYKNNEATQDKIINLVILSVDNQYTRYLFEQRLNILSDYFPITYIDTGNSDKQAVILSRGGYEIELFNYSDLETSRPEGTVNCAIIDQVVNVPQTTMYNAEAALAALHQITEIFKLFNIESENIQDFKDKVNSFKFDIVVNEHTRIGEPNKKIIKEENPIVDEDVLLDWID